MAPVSRALETETNLEQQNGAQLGNTLQSMVTSFHDALVEKYSLVEVTEKEGQLSSATQGTYNSDTISEIFTDLLLEGEGEPGIVPMDKARKITYYTPNGINGDSFTCTPLELIAATQGAVVHSTQKPSTFLVTSI
ncbi:MAG: hypothetical protein Q9M91_03470 [Candidatus Dojkabacteria bacterium]|nr:hypothetical protein [Candidatus Dojkabacteria bacterium]MDQ7020881.1 hypothetical protein [Candidatus Dojkabacteria bacterium]